MTEGMTIAELEENIELLNNANQAFRRVLQKNPQDDEEQCQHYCLLLGDTIDRFRLVKNQLKQYENHVDNMIVQLGKDTVQYFKLSDKVRYDILQISETIRKQDKENETLERQLNEMVAKLQKFKEKDEVEAATAAAAASTRNAQPRFMSFLRRLFK